MLIRVTPEVVETIFSSSPARAARILRNESDFYTELTAVARKLSSPAGRRAVELFGRPYLRDLATRVPGQSVSAEEARRIHRLYTATDADGPILDSFFGLDEDLVRRRDALELGQLLESDHLLEQRFYDAVRNGHVSLTPPTRRTTLSLRDPDRIGDIHALLVPKNEIIYYRIARRLRRVTGWVFGGLYPHVGPGSKTTQLARLIRPTFEPFYSVRQIADAHRYVFRHQMGMTPFFERSFLHDLAEAVLEGAAENPTLARQLSRQFGTTTPSEAAIVAHLTRGPAPGPDTFAPNVWPFWGRATVPSL